MLRDSAIGVSVRLVRVRIARTVVAGVPDSVVIGVRLIHVRLERAGVARIATTVPACRYAKLELVGYYCPGGQPGCVTFRYVFQGDGSSAVAVR